ncbi:MAG: GDP-mannose 4,6-dehydratase, partial [Bacteroidetes bacterium]|nr:GDP-mannose 4,6-dehydratase [Bacteroidota bacterium]
DVEVKWEGEGIGEKGINKRNGQTVIEIDPWYFRPTEVELLVGDPSKAKKVLDWESSVQYEELIQIMMKDALESA